MLLLYPLMMVAVVSSDEDGLLRLLDAPPAASDPGLNVRFFNLSTPRQHVIPAVLATVESPVGLTRVFAAGADPARCTKRVKTSSTAKAAGCLYAVNAAPFNMNTGACVGDVISGGTVINYDDTRAFASWGLSKTQHVFGHVSRSKASSLRVLDLTLGFIGGLLVDGGVPAVSASALVAARTAVGADASGRLLLLTVDGAEDEKLGMNITELAAAFQRLGAHHALNLDGGGSTAAWWKGHGTADGIIDKPTCNDNTTICERAVATVLCVMPPKNKQETAMSAV